MRVPFPFLPLSPSLRPTDPPLSLTVDVAALNQSSVIDSIVRFGGQAGRELARGSLRMA